MQTQTDKQGYLVNWTGEDYSLVWHDEEGDVLVKGHIDSYKEALALAKAEDYDFEHKS